MLNKLMDIFVVCFLVIEDSNVTKLTWLSYKSPGYCVVFVDFCCIV